MLYFDDAVVTPILRAVRSRGDARDWDAAERDGLRAAATAAGAFRYTLTTFRNAATGTDFLVLAEANGPRRRFWGTYVFRVAKAAPFVVQVPRPLAEQNSYEFGVALFDHTSAAVLALVGTHPDANRNHSADLLRSKGRVNLFNLVAQVVLREAGPAPMLLVQCRALGVSPAGQTPDADVVLATDNGATGPAALTSLGAQLYRALDRDRLAIRFADGSADTAGYGAAGSSQAGYLTQSANKELVIVWVTPVARPDYRQQTENDLQRVHFAALDLPTSERSLFDHLAPLWGRPEAVTVPADLRAAIEKYATTQDVVALHAAATRAATCGLHLERLIDIDSQRSFLIVHDGKRLPLVAKLAVRPGASMEVVHVSRLDRAGVVEYIRSRAVWLEIGGGS
jgi:hypothetical protein